MAMITPFGKFARKLRIDYGELLKDMADKLGVTSSYLSAIENGKRNVPRNWSKKLSELYSLNEKQNEELKKALEDSRIITKVDVRRMDSDDRDLMVALARNIDNIDFEKKKIIKNIIGNNY